MIKICFIGLGSIGQRHLRNLTRIKNVGKDCEIYAIRSVGAVLPDELENHITRVYSSIEEAPTDFDVIFVTNPTSMHYDTIKKTISHTKHMFIEKPVFMDDIKSMNELSLKKDSVYYVAAPMRHCPVIQKLREILSNEKVYSVRAISSSYLPEWRKGIDYRKCYSAMKSMGGGVELDLIHEIDYMTYLFGKPKKTICVKGKFSSLEIDSNDLADYILVYEDKLAEIHVDYFGRNAMRKIEVFCENYTIVGDFLDNTLKYVGPDYVKEVELKPDEDYMDEMKHFLALIEGQEENDNDICYANKILKMAKGEEE